MNVIDYTLFLILKIIQIYFENISSIRRHNNPKYEFIFVAQLGEKESLPLYSATVPVQPLTSPVPSARPHPV